MEQGIPAREENPRELFIVVRHHRRARGLLGHGEEVVDVLDGAEGLLPELELDRRVELREARVEVVLQRIRVGEVDAVRLVRILGDIAEMQAQRLAEPPELDLALVLEAELERLLRDLLQGAR